MTVELKVLDERVRAWGLPRYQSEKAAAVDLFACLDEPLVIAPQSAAQFVPSGIAIHIGDRRRPGGGGNRLTGVRELIRKCYL